MSKKFSIPDIVDSKWLSKMFDTIELNEYAEHFDKDTTVLISQKNGGKPISKTASASLYFTLMYYTKADLVERYNSDVVTPEWLKKKLVVHKTSDVAQKTGLPNCNFYSWSGGRRNMSKQVKCMLWSYFNLQSISVNKKKVENV